MNRILFLAALGFAGVSAFVPRNPARSASELYEVIKAEDIENVQVDPGSGGVRLAQESAIKITGEVRHKPGSAEARAMDLTRYTKLTAVDEPTVKNVLGKVGGKIIAVGQGKELYEDPGDRLEAAIKLAPVEAIKDAFESASSAIEEETIVLNFLGGKELVLGEVLDAASEFVVMMDIATKAKVYVNSMSHDSVPRDSCTLSVVAVREKDDGFSGAEESIASGEVYTLDGSLYTVEKANLNTDLA
mmetsp:Transcript_100532/g.290396  ORF Transcript_100532/g.290396 Transcript_100532/m.290396 type:complete len:245 (+) Transcript_100532:115-849(+)